MHRDDEPTADDVPVGPTQPAEQRHHSLGLAQRQTCLEDEAGVPAGGSGLEALVLAVGHLEQQQQRIREHHERMFA
jgi:hypothetical protein